jgi:replication factor C large subunit
MLLEKYRPRNLKEILGQGSLILEINKWLDEWKPGKALLISGQSGTGKTLVTRLIANEKRMNLFELDTSESRSASSVKEKLFSSKERPIIGISEKSRPIVGETLILVDDVDALGSSDRGGIAEVINVIKQSVNPIILTAKDAYDPKLKTLRNYCDLLKARRIPVNTIEKKLNEIAIKEKIMMSGESIRKLAENSEGDIRSAINDLSTYNDNAYRDRESNIFDVLHTVFRSKDLKKSLKALDTSDKDLDELFWWIEQNIILEYQDKELIAQSLEILSKADIFRSRIMKNQNFRFKKYMRDMLASISLLDNNQKRFIMYRPPGRFITLGATKVSRKDAEEFYRSLGLSCSLKKMKEQEPYLKMILGRKFKGS